MLSFVRQFYDSDPTSYALSGILRGHLGAVNAFAFNNNGTLLASGGDDEQVKIWDMKSLRPCQSLVHPQRRWGQVTCVKFIGFEMASAADWLCFGTGRGMVVIYRKSRRAAEFVEVWSLPLFSAGDSVEALAFDSNHQRLAIGSHYGQVKMLRHQNGKLAELWSDELRDAIPRALLFTDGGHSLTVFTLETGSMYVFKGPYGIGHSLSPQDMSRHRIITTKNLKTAIGHVSLCPLTGNFLVDNMLNGFDFYTPNRIDPLRTFRVHASRMFVRAGVFCESGKMVACGSDHGRVYIFGIDNEQVKQELYHGRKEDLIQAVEAKTANGFHVIVSGASGGDYNIYVWTKPIQEPGFREKRQFLESLLALNGLILGILLLLTHDAWRNFFKDMYVNFAAKSSHAMLVFATTEGQLPVQEALSSAIPMLPSGFSEPPQPTAFSSLLRQHTSLDLSKSAPSSAVIPSIDQSIYSHALLVKSLDESDDAHPQDATANCVLTR